MAIQIGGKEFDAETVQKLIDAGVLAGAKHDTSASTPNAVPLHGPLPGNNSQFGVFSSAGVRPGFFNATPRVRSIGQYIPMYKSDVMQELIDVATGVTAGSGTNQTSACAVGPKPGSLKAAKISATFGIIHESTKILDVTQAGMRKNRADIDREVYNTAAVVNKWLPSVVFDETQRLTSVLRAELYALGIELERNISQVHYLGVSGTEDNTYLGVARQWNGLDRLIRTGWTDADTGQAVSMLDAAVAAFNANADGGTDSAGRTVIAALIDTYYGQVDFLRRLGIQPVFALVMRPELFRALAAVWSCSYATTRCISSSAGAPVVRDAEMQRRLYEELLAGMYLPMEGDNVPVILDDAIPQDRMANNYYKSDIYGIALTGNGIPTLYGEYFDMANGEAMEAVNFMGLDAATTTYNDGLYRAFKRVTGGCLEYDFFARVRLVTNAPFMHFRLDDVMYRADYRQTSPIPGFTYAYRNGGATMRLT